MLVNSRHICDQTYQSQLESGQGRSADTKHCIPSKPISIDELSAPFHPVTGQHARQPTLGEPSYTNQNIGSQIIAARDGRCALPNYVFDSIKSLSLGEITRVSGFPVRTACPTLPSKKTRNTGRRAGPESPDSRAGKINPLLPGYHFTHTRG